jgi:hypothetical protein
MMMPHTLDHKRIAAGPCTDCGAMVPERKACVDGVSHASLQLCEVCWNVFRQRQMFAGGCCG